MGPIGGERLVQIITPAHKNEKWPYSSLGKWHHAASSRPHLANSPPTEIAGGSMRGGFTKDRGAGQDRSAPLSPRRRFLSRENMTTLRCSLYATAHTVACLVLLRFDLELPADIEDLYVQAFPIQCRLWLESDMTTRHFRVSTVTGLSQAGTLLLQAATLRFPCSTSIRLRLGVRHLSVSDFIR